MSKNSQTTSDLSFEEALHRLETSVAAMEAGDIPLSELVSRCEEASRLLLTCQRELRAAELRVEKLTSSGDEFTTEPFPIDAQPEV